MPRLLFIIGQTASGKSALSHHIAREHGVEIVSVDSMKVYRGMDVGTAKPSAARRAEVRYHMIDAVEPDAEIDVKWYVDAVDRLVTGSGGPFILAGGSAMYVKAILSGLFEGVPRDEPFRRAARDRIAAEGLEILYRELAAIDPEAGQRILPGDEKRIVRALEVHHVTGMPISKLQVQFTERRRDYEIELVGLRYPRPRLYELINGRVDRMFDDGLAAEVTALHAAGRLGHTASRAIGYRELITALDAGGDPASEEVRTLVKRNTRHFAKRQMTWFKKFEGLSWIDVSGDDTVLTVYEKVKPFLRSCAL